MPVVDTTSSVWNPNSDYIGSAGLSPKEDHLSVQDVALSQSVPVGGLLGWDGDYMQAVPRCYAPLAFDYISAFTDAAFETDALYARRLSTVLAGVLFTSSTATVTVYMLVKDSLGIYTVVATKQFSAIATLQDEDFRYLSISQEFTTYGADKVKFMVGAPSAGEISFRMAVV